MDIDDAIALLGSINMLAAEFDLTRQAVQSWRKHGIPIEHAAYLKTNRKRLSVERAAREKARGFAKGKRKAA